MTRPRQHTGREYLRVSKDRSGRARSVEEQHGDNERAAEDRGVRLGEPYEDNSVSASRYATKTGWRRRSSPPRPPAATAT